MTTDNNPEYTAMTAVNDYFYLVTIDPSAAAGLRVVHGNKYAKEFVELFGEYATYGLSRFAMTKEQLALFFYLRCRMGGQNGVKDLDMQRVRVDRRLAGEVIDMRARQPSRDEPAAPTTVELAKQLAQVDALLVNIADGKPLSIGGLELNSDHMNKVLGVQRQHLRAQLIASVSIPAV